MLLEGITGDACCAVHKDKDHASKSPCNAQQAHSTAIHDFIAACCSSADDGRDTHIDEQQSRHELDDHGPVEPPATQLYRID